MSEKKQKSAALPIILGLLIIVGVGGYLAYSDKMDMENFSKVLEETKEAGVQTDAPEIADQESTEAEVETVETADAQETATLMPFTPATELVDALPTNEALEKRVLGNPDAPLTVIEHSSLTCGHCGNFHRTSFKPVKENYVDTGKVKIIFDDFPLNAPALDASMVARCLPKENYFPYLQLLFEKQDEWAYSRNYIIFLKQSSQLAGLSPAGFDACINNEELRKGLLGNMKESQSTNDVSSTPTFILSTGKKITGSRAFNEFEREFEAALGTMNAPEDATASDATAEAEEPAEEPPTTE